MNHAKIFILIPNVYLARLSAKVLISTDSKDGNKLLTLIKFMVTANNITH
jgi:hypothetical protein